MDAGRGNATREGSRGEREAGGKGPSTNQRYTTAAITHMNDIPHLRCPVSQGGPHGVLLIEVGLGVVAIHEGDHLASEVPHCRGGCRLMREGVRRGMMMPCRGVWHDDG